MLWATLGGSLVGFGATGAALGAVMGLTGLLIIHYFARMPSDIAVLGVWNLLNSFTFSAVPVFIFMGELLVASGLSRNIYAAVAPLVRSLPGGLMHSNIVVSALFGSVSGSSAATSAAVAAVAYPELSARGYHRPAVAASLAAGGTLGLLIPPSLSLLIFGVWQDVSIGRLFLGGVLPGLLMAGLFMLFIAVDSRRRPNLQPPAEPPVPVSWRATLLGIGPLVILIGSVIGTIYLGLATPTEAAGLGVATTIILGVLVGDLTPSRAVAAALSSVKSFGALAFMLIGASVLSQALTLVGVPAAVVRLSEGLALNQFGVLVLVTVFFIAMGVFFDGISLMLTTVPFIYPMMVAAGFDPVWIGVFVTIMVEIGMLTPPVGVNLSVLMTVTKGQVTLGALGTECLPYWLMMLLCTGILALFPQIVLFLPNLAF